MPVESPEAFAEEVFMATQAKRDSEGELYVSCDYAKAADLIRARDQAIRSDERAKVEEWRPYGGGKYECSSLGRIRKAGADTVLSGTTSPRGYIVMSVTEGGIRRRELAHRMVAEAFFGPPPLNKPTVNHKDGIKSNNAIENLEYASVAENIQHAHRTGLAAFGERVANAVLDAETVAAMRDEHREVGTSVSALARKYGVPIATAKQAIRGDTWRHVAASPVERPASAAQRICRRGHPLSENAYIHRDGSRECGICKVDRLRAHRAKRKPLPPPPTDAERKDESRG